MPFWRQSCQESLQDAQQSPLLPDHPSIRALIYQCHSPPLFSSPLLPFTSAPLSLSLFHSALGLSWRGPGACQFSRGQRALAWATRDQILLGQIRLCPGSFCSIDSQVTVVADTARQCPAWHPLGPWGTWTPRGDCMVWFHLSASPGFSFLPQEILAGGWGVELHSDLLSSERPVLWEEAQASTAPGPEPDCAGADGSHAEVQRARWALESSTCE